MRLATLTKTQQSSPLAQAEQKQLRRLSAVVVLSTPLFAMTADYNDVHQRPSSANVPAPVPADCPRDLRDLSAIKAADRNSSTGTRLSDYTAIFVFFFFFLFVSPDFTLHSRYDSGSNSLLLRQNLDPG